jgi:hypothetical protein
MWKMMEMVSDKFTENFQSYLTLVIKDTQFVIELTFDITADRAVHK